MFACNIIIMSLVGMAKLSVSTLTIAPNLELDAATIDEMTAKVSGSTMKKLLKNAAAAGKKYDKSARNSLAYLNARDAIKQVTVDALPQLLEFLARDNCLNKGHQQMKLAAYVCQMSEQRKSLKEPGDTLSSCLTGKAKSAEDRSLIKLFEAKLKTDGAFCGKLPSNEDRPDSQLGKKFGDPAKIKDEYMKSFEEIAELLGNNNVHLATIQNDPEKQQAAGFFANLFHFGTLE